MRVIMYMLAATLLFRAFAVAAPPAPAPSAPQAGAARPIHYIDAKGTVSPVMAELIVGGLKGAEADLATAVIVQVDTPGGLDLSMREIVKAFLSSNVPVVVYVAPSGSRAASAGVFIAYAAHVAAMAPGTNIGSAHPVALGEKMDETAAAKAENDAAAYIRGIAERRGRNAAWAEEAVRKSVNVPAAEALKLGVIDLVAENRAELIEKLDGRKVTTPAGEVAMRTRGAEIKEVGMGVRLKVLDVISNPNVAYILMMIGLLGLYFELSNPGAVLPGVVGAISLILAFYAFQTLPINYAGLLLIGLAAVFFIAEIKVVSYGLLTVAGAVSLILGSLMLFESPLPFLRVSLTVMLPSLFVIIAAVAAAMYYAMRIHGRTPVAGAEHLVGVQGTAADDIGPSGGKVFAEGEYWDAVSDGPLKKGEKVRIVEVRGLVLKVEGI